MGGFEPPRLSATSFKAASTCSPDGIRHPESRTTKTLQDFGKPSGLPGGFEPPFTDVILQAFVLL
jgi:hypothetical protein